MITSIHHESLYPVIKILQKKRILLQPFSSKVLSKKTLIPCSWALQKQRLLNFLQTLLIIHGFFKSHFLTIRDFNIAKVLGFILLVIAVITDYIQMIFGFFSGALMAFAFPAVLVDAIYAAIYIKDHPDYEEL